MRRKDRQVSDLGEIAAMLDRCDVGRLALVDGDKPYIVPLNFGYERVDDRFTFYFHGARSGRKIDLIRVNPNACFEVESFYRVIPDEDPCEWTAGFESVIADGTATLVDDIEQRRHGLSVLMRHIGHEGALEFSDAILSRTQIIRFDADAITGKRNIPKSMR